ncbi:MAG: transglutaminase-like domain-containing protein [Cytophagales bacterium]|nr:transglutaminase-like domain-containing protein [Cytophagales bacterium]
MEVLDEKNLKALVSLLSDDDVEVLQHVEQKIISIGNTIIPYLEQEWESNFNPLVQKRIEELIHSLQYENVKKGLLRWKTNGHGDLLEGLWLICTYQYPDLEFEKLKAQIDQIYYDVWVEMRASEEVAFDKLKVINYAFFGKLKFSANTKNFHSISNSMLNVVLETRKGNPITLCCIYLMIAQKLKLPIYGVNLPNLFILTYKDDSNHFYINVFNKGLVFSKEDIDNYIAHLKLSPNPVFYDPCNNLDIIKRVLRNMLISFEKTGDTEKMQEIKDMLQSISDPGDNFI